MQSIKETEYVRDTTVSSKQRSNQAQLWKGRNRHTITILKSSSETKVLFQLLWVSNITRKRENLGNLIPRFSCTRQQKRNLFRPCSSVERKSFFLTPKYHQPEFRALICSVYTILRYSPLSIKWGPLIKVQTTAYNPLSVNRSRLCNHWLIPERSGKTVAVLFRVIKFYDFEHKISTCYICLSGQSEFSLS